MVYNINKIDKYLLVFQKMISDNLKGKVILIFILKNVYI